MGEFDQHEGEAQTIVNLAEAAMHMYRAAIDSLPFPEDKKFQKRAEVVLTGLRKLRAALTEAASHSRFWNEMAIFVIEDDTQNGPDHVDAHRTAGFVISPFCKRQYVDSTLYTTASMLRTNRSCPGTSTKPNRSRSMDGPGSSAWANPRSMVMPRRFSSCRRSASMPVSALTSAVFP